MSHIQLGLAELILLDGDEIVEQQAIGEAIAACRFERRLGQPRAIKLLPLHGHVHVGICVGQATRGRAAERDHAHLRLAGVPAGDLAGKFDSPLASVVHCLLLERRRTKDERPKQRTKEHSSLVFRLSSNKLELLMLCIETILPRAYSPSSAR
jgi:hypothetical protein